jgi:DNA-binding response OmpR family regulator
MERIIKEAMRILLVEDDHTIAQALKEGLEQESFAVDAAYDGEEGYYSAASEEYDLIILDLMLPGMDGLEIARRLRQENNHTRILMLTAKDQTPDKIRGLNTGADDYMIKPFSFEELLARVRALLRRPHEKKAEIMQARDLTLNTITKEVQRGGQTINLSSKEYALLEFLLRNQGKVMSKNSIVSHVWDFDADILPNTVEVFIKYLRDKVDKPFKGPELIQTVRGFGYKVSA